MRVRHLIRRAGIAAAVVTGLIVGWPQPTLVRAEDKAQKDPQAEQPIKASDKAAIDAAAGKAVVVEGVVSAAAWSASGKVLNIDFEDTKESKFRAAAFAKIKEALDKAFEGDAAKNLVGKKVRISGTLKTFKERTEIVIDSEKTITVVAIPAETPKP